MAPMIDVPGDTLSLYLGVHARWELIDDFRKIDGLELTIHVNASDDAVNVADGSGTETFGGGRPPAQGQIF